MSLKRSFITQHSQGKGHATPWGPRGGAPVWSHGGVGQSLRCGFHGRRGEAGQAGSDPLVWRSSCGLCLVSGPGGPGWDVGCVCVWGGLVAWGRSTQERRECVRAELVGLH